MKRPILNVIRDVLLSKNTDDEKIDIFKTLNFILNEDEIDYLFNINFDGIDFNLSDNEFSILIKSNMIIRYSSKMTYIMQKTLNNVVSIKSSRQSNTIKYDRNHDTD